MALTHYTHFKHITHIGDTDFITQIEYNLKHWLDWCLLGIGAWVDVNIPQTGIDTGLEHKLRYTLNPAFTDGRVWEGFRKDWVWETGVEYSGPTGDAPEPIAITGVTVNNMSYASGHPTYGWYVNYPAGQVIFNMPLASGTNVQAEYSYRYVQTYVAEDTPWWRELQYRSLQPNDTMFVQQNKERGDWSIGSHHRVQMPSVIIEAVPRGSSRGYELGNNALTVNQDVLFNIIAENRQDRNKLLSTLMLQNDKPIYLYNIDSGNSDFPLDYRGALTGTKMYPDIIDAHKWKICRFINCYVSEVDSVHPNLYEGNVRMTIEFIYGDI